MDIVSNFFLLWQLRSGYTSIALGELAISCTRKYHHSSSNTWNMTVHIKHRNVCDIFQALCVGKSDHVHHCAEGPPMYTTVLWKRCRTLDALENDFGAVLKGPSFSICLSSNRCWEDGVCVVHAMQYVGQEQWCVCSAGNTGTSAAQHQARQEMALR